MFERVRRRRRKGPLLSVIVPVYNVEAYLDACLTSIRQQRYASIEVVIVDDGSPDNSMAIARRHTEADNRVRIVERPNGGLSAARNTGVAAARGEFLTFVDSDDLVTADGFVSAMRSLDKTGSQIAVLRYGRLREGKPASAAKWIRQLHAQARLRTTLEQCPLVMVNATAWAKVLRRDFYEGAGLAFVEGVIYEDQAFTAAAYAAADSIDVLPVTGYLWRVNDTSLSQGQVTVENLSGRLAAAEDSLAVLDGHPARAERALQQARYNLPNSLLKLERAEQDYLDQLIERVPPIVSDAPTDRFRAEVPAQFRVLYALIEAGDSAAVWRYVRAGGMESELHPASVEPAGLTSHLPGWGTDPVPPHAYVLTADQTALAAKIHAVRRQDADLVVELAAWFPNVDAVNPVLSATAGGTSGQVVNEGQPADFTSRSGQTRSYPGSGWTVTFTGAARRPPLQIELRLEDSILSGRKIVRLPSPVA